MNYAALKNSVLTKKSALGLCLLFAVTAFTPIAQAALTNTNVTVVSSSESSAQVSTGQTNTLTATIGNTGGNVANILVDVELYNESGNKVGQQFWDNQLIPPTQPVTFHFTTPTLQNSGNYHFSIGLFQTGWSGLIGWYDSVQKFAVGGQDGNVVMVNNSILPGAINSGDTATLSAQLASPNTANTILLDFELRDAGGNKVFQKFWDNLTIPQRGYPGQVQFTVQTPTTLPSGTYYFSIGIFKPGWQGLTHWYSNTQTLTVTPSGQIAVQQIQRPKSNVPQGQSFTVAPTLISQNGDSVNVTVAIYLINSANSVADSSVASGQTLVSNTPKNFSLTSNPNLPAGNYAIAIKIFNNNGSVRQEFSNLGSVTVQ